MNVELLHAAEKQYPGYNPVVFKKVIDGIAPESLTRIKGCIMYK